MSAKQIKNIEEFENLIKTSNDYYVLDFYANWCGPCQLMLPIFEKVSNFPELQNYRFAKINRDENYDLVEKYGFNIPTIPRFFVVKFTGDGFFSKEKNILLEMGGTQSKTDMLNKLLEIAKEEGLQISDLNQDNGSTKKITEVVEMSPKKKVAIIGSGPSGLTAGIYTSRAELDTTIFLGMQPGGQLTTTTEIENFPGAFDKETKKGMMGLDLVQLIQLQAEHFGAKTLFEEVISIVPNANKFVIKTSNQESIFDAVIIASGASARYLGVKGEEKFVGKGYHSCATCDGFFYKNKVVAIVGGGDSAMEEANFLTKFAEKVYLIHRNENFRASKIMLERVKNNPKIEILTNKVIESFIGENKVIGVNLKNTKTNEISKLDLDGVFVAIGHIPNTGFVGNILDKDNSGYLIPQLRVAPEIRVSKYNTATKIPGVFVAGDVSDTEYRQAITAAGDGCRAAMDCEKWLAH
jgi:thioredoxin reductase (NADPH)